MRGHIRFSIGSLLATAIVVAALSLGGAVAKAQSLTWNPPCGSMTVYNLTGCQADLTMVMLSNGPVPPISVPACPGVVTVGLPSRVIIFSVVTQAGNQVPLQSPAPAFPPVFCPMVTPAPTTIADRWVQGVTLGPSGCCFDVYFYTTNDPVHQCTVFLTPGTAPCIP